MVELWVCTEYGYQIWRGYLKWFKSYKLSNKTNMAASRHLGFLEKIENFKIRLNSRFVLSLDTKIWRGYLKRFESYNLQAFK